MRHDEMSDSKADLGIIIYLILIILMLGLGVLDSWGSLPGTVECIEIMHNDTIGEFCYEVMK